MGVLYIIGSVVFTLLCFAIIAIVLLQQNRSTGLSSSVAGMGATQTYWDKNKGRSFDGSLERYTKIGGALFLIFSLLFPFVH